MSVNNKKSIRILAAASLLLITAACGTTPGARVNMSKYAYVPTNQASAGVSSLPLEDF